MKQESLAVSVQEADAIECLRNFFRKLDDSAEAKSNTAGVSKPAKFNCSGVENLPISTLSNEFKPPF